MRRIFLIGTGLLLSSGFTALDPVHANNSSVAAAGQDRATSVSSDVSYARFAPKQTSDTTRIDYSYWDEALRYFVFPMGRSARTGAPSLSAELGTRRIYGHDSRLRLEGNRVGFSFLKEPQISALTEYRKDLEQTASLVDIGSLPRNEQLAYWMNLHNVAVIEQIAKAYPLSQPSQLKIGPDRLSLDEAKIVTVSGVALSPHDIRTKIVYPNWSDPRVIYGFFRGEIGGPTIQKESFRANNLGDLLSDNAIDFINSLRGTEKRGRTLHVSEIYAEAAPFYFRNWESDLKAHLYKYGTEEVRGLIDRTSAVKASIYEKDVSDLAGGERDPEHGYVSRGFDAKGWGFEVGNADTAPVGVPRNIGRLVVEKRKKYRQLLKNGMRRGEVIFLDDEEVQDRERANEEVE